MHSRFLNVVQTAISQYMLFYVVLRQCERHEVLDEKRQFGVYLLNLDLVYLFWLTLSENRF